MRRTCGFADDTPVRAYRNAHSTVSPLLRRLIHRSSHRRNRHPSHRLSYRPNRKSWSRRPSWSPRRRHPSLRNWSRRSWSRYPIRHRSPHRNRRPSFHPNYRRCHCCRSLRSYCSNHCFPNYPSYRPSLPNHLSHQNFRSHCYWSRQSRHCPIRRSCHPIRRSQIRWTQHPIRRSQIPCYPIHHWNR